MNYYNDFDPYCCQWLRNLIDAGELPPGDVDERSITDVQPEDLEGYTQCHFFAGIGGWPLALQLAGWPADAPAWTGSCPCQPFSAAGKGLGEKDPRHLWPEFLRLIAECRPEVIFGEQVASAEVVGTQLEAAFAIAVQSGDYARANKLAKRLVKSRGFHYWSRWVDRVHADLEAADYALRYAILGAHSVGAPHIRQRLFWVADRHGPGCRRTNRQGQCRETGGTGTPQIDPGGDGTVDRLADATNDGHEQREHRNQDEQESADQGWGKSQGMRLTDTPNGGHTHRLADAGRQRDERRGISGELARPSGTTQGEARQRQRSGDADRDSGTTDRVGDASPGGLGIDGSAQGDSGHAAQPDAVGGLGNAWSERLERGLIDERSGQSLSAETSDAIVCCRDGKTRRVPQSCIQPLAHGIPRDLGRTFPELAGLAKGARRNRIGRLRGYGNAIVPHVAAEFIKAFMESHT